MRTYLSYALRLALVMGVAVTMAACGGAGGGATSTDTGGGELAPTGGGGGSPVAVEIPALGDVSGLPYASGTVVPVSSDIVAAIKAKPGSWVAKSFNLTTDTFVTGDSKAACEYRNTAAIALGAMTLPDNALCTIQANVASFSTPYDGNYHILLQQSVQSMPAGVPNKTKFKFTRDSSNIITAYEAFVCDNTNTQLTYVSYTISSGVLTATLKTIRSAEPQRSLVNLTGTLNVADPTQYTAKSGAYSYTGSNNAGALEGAVSLTQAAEYMLLDAFDSRGGGGNVVRIYGQADQSNASSPLSISSYIFGAGAADLIDSNGSSTECWDGTTNDPIACTGRNSDAISGKTPQVVATQTVPSFSGSDAWDCSGDAEVTAAIAMDDSDSASSCFRRFSLDSSHIDCTGSTDGGFTVTAAVGGTALGTSFGSATSVSANPSLVLTLNRAANTSTFIDESTVTLTRLGVGVVSLGNFSSGWSNGSKLLTLSPALVSGQTYKLTITGGDSGVKSATGDTSTMAATVDYYMQAQ